MKKNVFITLWMTVLFLMIFSCKKDSVVFYDLGQKYFPISLHEYSVFLVDCTAYNGFTLDTTFHTKYVKILYSDVFTDNEGDTVFKTLFYEKSKIEDSWRLNQSTITKVLPQRIEFVEQNTTYIKFIFPVKNNSTWNENAFNTLDDNILQYKNVHNEYSDNFKLYDSTVTVFSDPIENLITIKTREEIYSKNIGLVSKLIKDIDIQNSNGYIIQWTFLEKNKE